MNRRHFLGVSATLPFMRWSRGIDLRIGLKSTANDDDVLAGARMAESEAARAAMLLNANVRLVQSAAEVMPLMILASTDAALADDVRQLAGATVIISATAPPLVCAPNVLHLQPARAQCEQAGGRCELWDGNREKFGAAQLNDRYRAANHAAMTSNAWAGWFAVKLLWESALRTRSDDASEIAAFLLSERAAFDGHKGELLRFAPASRLLQQPLYIMKDGEATEWHAPPSSYAVSPC